MQLDTRVTDLLEGREVPAWVAKAPAGELVEVLRAACDQTVWDIGYRAFAVVARRLETDDEFFRAGLALLVEPGLGATFNTVWLDYLDGAARAKETRGPGYYTVLCGLAASADRPESLRQAALRRLARCREQTARNVVAQAIRGGQPALVDGAAHVLVAWMNDRVELPPTAIGDLLTFAKSRPEAAVRSAGVLQALAASKDGAATAALRELGRSCANASDRVRYLAAAGPTLTAIDMARELRAALADGEPTTLASITGLLASRPELVDGLRSAGHHAEYLAASLLSPTGQIPARDLLELTRSGDPGVAQLATTAAKLAPPAPELEEIQRTVPVGEIRVPLERVAWFLQREGAVSPTPGKAPDLSRADGLVRKLIEMAPGLREPVDAARVPISTNKSGLAGWPRSAAAEFSTGLHTGDAMYRNLITRFGNNEHWHTGIFLGFKPRWRPLAAGLGLPAPSQSGPALLGVCAGGSNMAYAFFVDTIVSYVAAGSLAAPDADVAAQMRSLFSAFVLEFQEHKPAADYHGSRCPPTVTESQRRAIAATAASLMGRGIRYCFEDMLDNRGWTWSGTVDGIEQTRCDGVVEFSYEANGVRVCGGTDPNRWNIAAPGNANIENHNELHTYHYSHGELCPRIQANDLNPDSWHAGSTDTMFGPDDRGVPTVPEYIPVTGGYVCGFPVVPSISFKLGSGVYSRVFVRITVSKDGGPYNFLQSNEHPYGTGPTTLTTWDDHPAPTNTQDPQVIFWTGETVGGPNFWGQSGDYDFRLVAIDEGGNVSAERAQVIHVNWPTPNP
ncbi:MAG: hypothetical protein NVSMB51_01210 [Solirubrobacteraceae bacterium]